MKAIRIRSFGGPEVMQLEDVPTPEPSAGQVRVRAQAMGINFVDMRMRAGIRPLPLPTGIGLEAVGIVDAVGPDVNGFKPGDRVGYFLGPPGAYAELHCVSAAQLVRPPETIPAEIVIGLLTKTITAQYLLHRAYKVTPGEKILVHAAAGGVGQIMTQWAKALGATVVGGVGSSDKVEVATRNGCDHVVNTREAGWAEKVRQLTGGVDVVYDSVGKDTFNGSIDALKVRGALVCFGASSGPLPPIELQALGARGSYRLMSANGFHFSRNEDEIREGFSGGLAAHQAGHIKPSIHQIMPLAEAAEAHRALESRKTKGGLVLLP